MAKWYFTFGFDFGGGWAEVTADNFEAAEKAFESYHSMIECAFPYTEADFMRTSMPQKGNGGVKCREQIVLNRFQYGDS